MYDSHQSGDIMLLYTDGITEAKNFKREEYGYERLKETLEANKELPAEDLRDKLIQNLYEFSGEQDVDDDYTLVLVKFK